MNHLLLYAIAFIANAAVLVFEIAGVRFLAPYLGTSTEVWAGLIAVILGGLAAGYWLGGRLSREHLSYRTLATFLFLASASAYIAWLLRDTVPTLALSLSPSLSLTTYAILAGSVLFAPATVFLGAVSPYTVRLAISNLDSAGSLIGNFSAVGAAGSIVGAILTGMFLIPSFGLGSIILGVAVVLGALAIVAAAPSLVRGVFGVVVLFGLAGIANAAEPNIPGNVVADVDTRYSRVWVTERKGEGGGTGARYLKTDPFGVQCGMLFDTSGIREDILLFPYLKAFAVADTLIEPRRALMLGGCNYSYPRFFLKEHPGASMDVIEIDPGMTALARAWFGLVDQPGLSIIHADARTAMKNVRAAYDVIYMDAYNSFSSIPFQLTTREFFASARAALTDDGVFVANVIGALEGPYANFTGSLYRTLGEVFPSVAIYKIGVSGGTSPQNLILLATKDADVKFAERPFAYGELVALLPRGDQDVLRARGMLLTDDYAPTESLSRPLRDAATVLLSQGYALEL